MIFTEKLHVPRPINTGRNVHFVFGILLA